MTLFGPLLESVLALKPPTETAPCAVAYTRLFAARSSVITSVPPCRLVASPIADTVTSALSPEWAKGPRFAVTMTAATSRVRTSCEVVESPNDCSTFWIVFDVNAADVESPVWLRPVTMP